ncbi:MAG: dihydropteroate synthase [Bacteroidales bacterium]|nr:dihydropteroate synthase [Bacteroidales bacterium]MCF8337623.1 dihydropteroate synthase [Bacteroidales bacterium]
MENRILNSSEPLVMGILNITPDSFYDGGKYTTEKEWMQKAEEIVKEGGHIIDLGAISTRPGAKEISEKEEKERLQPALRSIRKEFPDTSISVDTYRSNIAQMAVNEGADIINDISGGSMDDNMLNTISKLKVPYIITHIKGSPQNMQRNPDYDDVIEDIATFFRDRIFQLNELGFDDIILDPGFGFGKSISHNYRILRKLRAFRIMGYPVLAGLSRKSMINRVLNVGPEDALNGTTILNTIALNNGASILRVHDVKEAIEAIALVSLVSNA